MKLKKTLKKTLILKKNFFEKKIEKKFWETIFLTYGTLNFRCLNVPHINVHSTRLFGDQFFDNVAKL